MRKPRANAKERRDVDARLLILFATGLILFVALALAGLHLTFGGTPSPLSFGAGQSFDAGRVPALDPDPRATRAAFDRDKRSKLDRLAWVDRGAGIAQIPIAEAMRLLVAHGVPDWGQNLTPTDAECAVLAANVPRAPAAEHCRAPRPDAGSGE